ncbi:MAG: hypothetical protein IKK32_05795 [Oscillospiraceae bacterium]|nr:hypothetical protein [Oscillospiraceae bacterium]MBR4093366.1 hypothetical protein [Oscillospiraceae bacterium]
MVKIITGKKGSGKTKVLIDMINEAAKLTSGNIVCIEKGLKLTYDINHSVRLTDMEDYNLEGIDMFYGFVNGMIAGNFDIKEIYVDGILKVVGRDYAELGILFDKLDKITGDDIKCIITVSADDDELPDSVMKYKM